MLNEDDYLLQEILFNPHTPEQIEHIEKEMDELLTIIKNKDADRMKAYLTKIRTNLAANK